MISCSLALESKHSDATMLKECKDNSRPCGHMAVSSIKRYWFQYTIPPPCMEPCIGSIDTWYLVSPSTVNWGSKYRWNFSLSSCEFVNRNNKVVMPYSDRYAGEVQWLECDFTTSHHSGLCIYCQIYYVLTPGRLHVYTRLWGAQRRQWSILTKEVTSKTLAW